VKVRGQVCAKAGGWRKARQKNEFLWKISVKPAQKRKLLTVQGDSGKIIDIGRRKLCCLRDYPGNVRLPESEKRGREMKLTVKGISNENDGCTTG
jgi:hypothetical protein